MVLDIVRERARQGNAGVVGASAASGRHNDDSWRAERGQVRFECQVDVIGGFPGGASHGGRLEGAQLRITDRYLLVDEGRAHGFGLPIGWLCGARTLAQSDRPDAALRLRYLDGSVGRGFVLKFRGPLLQLRGPRRAEQALGALRAAGLPEAAVGAASADPGLHLDWEEATRYEQENVIWSGTLTAPIGAGLERTSCNIWLTTRSVIWGSGAGRGIHRVALEHILDVAAVDTIGRHVIPTLIVGVKDAAGDRHDLAFHFNRQTPERNVRERGACLVGLRSRGIPQGVPPAPVQPWQPVSLAIPDLPTSVPGSAEPPPADLNPSSLSLHPPVEQVWDTPSVAIDPDPISADEATGAPQIIDPSPPPPSSDLSPEAPDEPDGTSSAIALAPLQERTDDSIVRGIAAPVATPTPPEALPKPAAATTLPAEEALVASSGGLVIDAPSAPPVPVDPAGAEAPSSPESVDLPDAVAAVPDAPAATPWPVGMSGLEQVEIYEAVARRLLAEVLSAIDARVGGQNAVPLNASLPSEALRAAAFTEIASLEKSGNLSRHEADSRRARLIAVGEAGPRLRSLLELRDAGWLSDRALAQKRQTITSQLSCLLADPSLLTSAGASA